MKIALTVDPEIPVPPIYYGGIERIVDMLVNEYVNAGHEVTVFANGASEVCSNLVAYSGKSSVSRLDTWRNMKTITQKIYAGNFDLVHSFSRLAYLTFLLPLKIPKIMSYQREPTISQIIKAQRLAKKGSLVFTGCSDYISKQIKPHAEAFTIYNGFPVDRFTPTNKVGEDAPLVFLGRIEPIKGPLLAIEIAKKSNKKLIIAGNIPQEYQEYFDINILPHIDHNQIRYIGPVNDEDKSHLLGNALAFLMPIEWDEPFGIVMVEAMACGTPVIALSRGASPEIINEGVTGFICESVDQCIEKVKIIHSLNRRKIREETENRFSSFVIANEYLNLYNTLLSRSN